MSDKLKEAREKTALQQFAKFSEPMKVFVRKLYAVRHDRQSLAAVFDNERPHKTKLVLWEVAAIADTVRYLPDDWDG